MQHFLGKKRKSSFEFVTIGMTLLQNRIEVVRRKIDVLVSTIREWIRFYLCIHSNFIVRSTCVFFIGSTFIISNYDRKLSLLKTLLSSNFNLILLFTLYGKKIVFYFSLFIFILDLFRFWYDPLYRHLGCWTIGTRTG